MPKIIVSGVRHEKTETPCVLIEQMAKNREQILAEVRRRWQEKDPHSAASWGTMGPALN